MSWVAPNLTDGLGNRLFQMAAALGAAEKWSIKPVFFTPRIAPSVHSDCSVVYQLFSNYNLPKVELANSWKQHIEPPYECWKYTDLPSQAPGNQTVLQGYFQSEKYFHANRDEIIRDFLFNMNMNPYANNHINLYDLLNTYNSNQNLFEESIEEIIKIKQCIYEGYKLNIATYNSEKNIYISNFNGYEIDTNSYLLKNLPSLKNGKHFIDNKPKYILYDSLTIKQNFNGDYTFSVSNCVSVLSGYVNIDFSFL